MNTWYSNHKITILSYLAVTQVRLQTANWLLLEVVGGFSKIIMRKNYFGFCLTFTKKILVKHLNSTFAHWMKNLEHTFLHVQNADSISESQN